jgi:hypothetical protein
VVLDPVCCMLYRGKCHGLQERKDKGDTAGDYNKLPTDYT